MSPNRPRRLLTNPSHLHLRHLQKKKESHPTDRLYSMSGHTKHAHNLSDQSYLRRM
jgi:hypothetical protein